MQRNFQEEERHLKAQKKVAELKAFYIHIVVTILLIPFLILINYITSWSFKWFWFPTGGILVSIVIHGITVFYTGTDWEVRKMKEFMEKDNF